MKAFFEWCSGGGLVRLCGFSEENASTPCLKNSKLGGRMPMEVVKAWQLAEELQWFLQAEPLARCSQNNKSKLMIGGGGEHGELLGLDFSSNSLLAWPVPASVYLDSDFIISSYNDFEARERQAKPHVVAFQAQNKSIPFRVRYLTPQYGHQRRTIQLVAPCSQQGPLPSTSLSFDAPLAPIHLTSLVVTICSFVLSFGAFFIIRELRYVASNSILRVDDDNPSSS
mmetsp:Transcript_8734/g.12122  ORF Transcript_8734/g.12122 Transcript_8734/m.12122 type:complete len:226 (+) Transcript_8734:32-709(+)